MDSSFFHVDNCILDIVINPVQNCSLFDDEDGEIFEKNSKRVNGVCQLVNFLAAVLGAFHLCHVFFQRQALVCNCLVLLSSTSMQLLHLHIVILLHFAQCEGNVLEF